MWQPFVLFLLLPSLLLLLIANSIRKSAAARPNSIKLPPSPPKLPIIGNLHQLLGGRGSLFPRSLRALSNRYGSPAGLMFLQLGCVPTIVVSSPEMAREILKTQDPVFANRPPSKMSSLLSHGNTHSNLSPNGEGWRQARKLGVAHLLGSKMVQSFQHIREEEVALMATEITHRMSNAGSVNMSEIIVTFIGYVISRVVLGPLFGEERHRIHALLEILQENNYLLAAFHLGDFFPVIGSLNILNLDARAKRTAKRMDAVLEEILEHYTNNNKMVILEDDHQAAHEATSLANVLLSLEKGCSSGSPVLTRENVKTLLLDMLSAGTDTTSFVLERSLAELVRHPKVMEKLQGEVRRVAGCNKAMVREEDLGRMMYLKAVIKEVLRLHPPGEIFFPRETMEDCQLGGYYIPKKTRVIIDAWAIGRDPRYWEEAEEFNPERFMNSSMDYMGNDFQFTPFGGGRRSCTGMNFALQNIEIALANLVYGFDWELPPADIPNDEPAGRVEEGLYLVAKPVA